MKVLNFAYEAQHFKLNVGLASSCITLNNDYLRYLLHVLERLLKLCERTNIIRRVDNEELRT